MSTDDRGVIRALTTPPTNKNTMQLTHKLNSFVHGAVNKTAAAAKIGTGITGDIVATGVTVIGGVIALTGAAVAAVGVGTYAGGRYVMNSGARLSHASMQLTDDGMSQMSQPAPPQEEPEAPFAFAQTA